MENLSRKLRALRTAEGTALLTNGGWSLLNQLARVASLAFVMIALSRHFGPLRFGALAIGLAFVRIFGVVAAFGLDRVIVQHLVQAELNPAAVLRKAFFLKFWIAFASYVAMLGLAFVIDPADSLGLSIVALAGAGLLFQCFDIFDFAFQAQGQFRFVFFGRALPMLAGAGVKLFAIAAGAPLLAFAALETLEAGAIALTLFAIYRSSRQEGESLRRHDSVRFRGLLAQGFPLLLGSLAVMIYMRCDILLLGKFAGREAAGLYSAASQLVEASALLPLALLPALFPTLVRWRARGPAFYRRQFEKLFLGAAVAGVAISIFLTFAAPLLLRLLFGTAYLPAMAPLLILAWTPVFVFIGLAQSGYDITEGLTWLATIRTAAGALINVGLCLVLIPKYGPTGAATSTLISFACSAFLLNFAQSRTRPIFSLQLRAMLLFPVFRPLPCE